MPAALALPLRLLLLPPFPWALGQAAGLDRCGAVSWGTDSKAEPSAGGVGCGGCVFNGDNSGLGGWSSGDGGRDGQLEWSAVRRT